MKQIFYHGTSVDNLNSILQNGLSTDESKIWNCSCDEVYLWSVEKLAEYDGMEDEEQEYKEEAAFRCAFESAQIACAIAKDCRAVVIKIELDENEIELDYSCENMSASGAVVVNRNILPSEFLEIKISQDLSLLKGYFIHLLSINEYSGCEFTKLELAVAKCFEGCEIIDEIKEIASFEEYEFKAMATA